MSHPASARPSLPRREIPASGRVLVLLTHPAFHRSRANRALADAIQDLEGVTLHDLYEAYPEHDIDVKHEQALLLNHPVVIFQHPFYWYSTPSLLKEWQDLVLEFGWAYGPGGRALQGKLLLCAITTGGSEEAYQPEGFNRFTIRQLLAPIDQTAHLCGMTMLPPFVVHGTHRQGEAALEQHAADYRRVMQALVEGRIDPARVAALPRLNHDLATVLDRPVGA